MFCYFRFMRMKNRLKFYVAITVFFVLGCEYHHHYNKEEARVSKKQGLFLHGSHTFENRRTDTLTLVQSSLISNEITLKEFRTFLKDLIAHPDDSISFYPSYAPLHNENLINVKKGMVYQEIISESPKEIFRNQFQLTDSAYYFDERLNDYPVTGISFQQAEIFCRWRIENEIKQNKYIKTVEDKKRVYFHIPDLEEWDFLTQMLKLEDSFQRELVKVSHRKLNNLRGNADEFIMKRSGNRNIPPEIYVVNSGGDLTKINVKTRLPYAGFRIQMTNFWYKTD